MTDESPIFLTPSVRVEMHIIGNPGCTTRQLANAIDIGQNAANTIAMRLREKGKVIRYYIEGDKRSHWKQGREDGIRIVEPKPRGKYKPQEPGTKYEANRPVVKKWEPCTVRDPLLDLFFGRSV